MLSIKSTLFLKKFFPHCPFFANLSAISLPMMPLCPFILTSFMFIDASLISIIILIMIKLLVFFNHFLVVESKAELIELIAPKLSVYIVTLEFSGAVSNAKKIATISALVDDGQRDKLEYTEYSSSSLFV